jgi:hypothetical protein
VSCDNARDLLTLMHPRPPSIDINTQTIARLAVERLFWRMKNGLSSPSVTVTVSPTLNGDSAADESLRQREHQPVGLAATLPRTIHRDITASANGNGDGDGHVNADGDGTAHVR